MEDHVGETQSKELLMNADERSLESTRELPPSTGSAQNPGSPIWRVVGIVFLLAVLAWSAFELGIWLFGYRCVYPRHVAEMQQCKNNLKQIGLALHQYHDKYGSFPPPYLTDSAGKPMHSWRVLILPFCDDKWTDFDGQALYDAYDFSKPWDAPENEFVLNHMPEIFQCPSDGAASNVTSYAGVFGKGCAFDPEGPVRIKDFKDGCTNTLLVGEVRDANIPWTKPDDVDISQHPSINATGGFGSHHEGGCQFVLCTGTVRFISEKTPSETLQNLFHRNDGSSVADAFSGE